jgi:hypothetical protein
LAGADQSSSTVQLGHPGTGVGGPIRFFDEVRTGKRRTGVRRKQVRSGFHGSSALAAAANPKAPAASPAVRQGTRDEADEVLRHVDSPSVLATFG